MSTRSSEDIETSEEIFLFSGSWYLAGRQAILLLLGLYMHLLIVYSTPDSDTMTIDVLYNILRIFHWHPTGCPIASRHAALHFSRRRVNHQSHKFYTRKLLSRTSSHLEPLWNLLLRWWSFRCGLSRWCPPSARRGRLTGLVVCIKIRRLREVFCQSKNGRIQGRRSVRVYPAHRRSGERSDLVVREARRTIESIIEEIDEEDGGGCKLQLCEGEVTHLRVRHFEFAFRWRLVCTDDEPG